MRTLLRVMLVAAPLFGFAAPFSSADPVQEHTREQSDGLDAPTQVLMAWARAINSKDVAAMGQLVMDKGDAFTVFEGSGSNSGWADYRDHHLAPEFANPDLVFHTYAFENIRTRHDGDLAYSIFSINMDYTYKGERKTRTGRGTAIMVRDGDVWKLVHVHTS